MTKEKPAEMRSLMKFDELKTTSAKVARKGSSCLSILQATFVFVGGFGRVLKFIDDIVEWWNNSH
jgi:hypothetical protein